MSTPHPDYPTISWASKHPELETANAPRHRGPLTAADKETRKRVQSEKREREISLGLSLQEYDEWSTEKLAKIADEHGLTLEYLLGKLGCTTKYKKKRAVRLDNAIAHFKAISTEGMLYTEATLE